MPNHWRLKDGTAIDIRKMPNAHLSSALERMRAIHTKATAMCKPRNRRGVPDCLIEEAWWIENHSYNWINIFLKEQKRRSREEV